MKSGRRQSGRRVQVPRARPAGASRKRQGRCRRDQAGDENRGGAVEEIQQRDHGGAAKRGAEQVNTVNEGYRERDFASAPG